MTSHGCRVVLVAILPHISGKVVATLSSTVEAALNQHINTEVYSSYLYYAMAAHFTELGLKGFAHWMRIQVWHLA